MISQKQIKEWIPGALSAFQSIMPAIPVPYPEIRIASSSTLYKVRAALVAQTESLNPNMKEPYTSVMETLYGEGGFAILIYQKYCPDSQKAFNHIFWHELGHFYAIAAETESFSYLVGQELDEDRIRQTGYWVWSEFIAECIANYIDGKVNPINKEKFKCEKYWREPYFRIQQQIQFAFKTYSGSFSEYDLAFYFATLLTDPGEGAFNDELTVWNPNKCDYVMMKPDSIEPTAISLLPEIFLDPLFDLMYFLKDKVAEKEFWRVDGAFLDKLGMMVTDLNDIKMSEALRQAIDKY